MKFIEGYVENAGKHSDIVVKGNPLSKNGYLGAVLTVIGIVIMVRSSFRNGSKAYVDAELKALTDIDSIMKVD